ncbi:MAG: 6-phosphogluconolactonase [Propionibacteriaceae bacterium]|jgi:6-phosphogluconolactonase|nr:6-phosphogluconolactonase [Propionibacteriaceae bacterium]
MTERRPSVIVHPSAELTAEGAASRLIVRLVERQSLVSPLHLSLTGGGLGTAMWSYVARHPLREAVDWSSVHLWWSDERFLPAGDPNRNDTAVLPIAAALGVPATQRHSVPGPDRTASVEVAADDYAAELGRWAVGDTLPAPRFDISLLGIGDDGHIASLFPGHEAAARTDALVVAEPASPKPPAQRVTFTRVLLRQCHTLWILAAGVAKSPAVSRSLAGDDPANTPASRLVDHPFWLVDAELAAALDSTPAS